MREYTIGEKEKAKIRKLQKEEKREFEIGDTFYFLLDDRIIRGEVDSMGISPKGDKVLYFYCEYCFSCTMMYLTPKGLCDSLLEEYKFRNNDY